MYHELSEIETLVHQFEDLTLPESTWNHRAHLTVCLYYLMTYSKDEAVRRTRDGIQRLNASYGVEMTPDGGYHETITLFWLWYGRRFLAGCPSPDNVVACVNGFVEEAADKRILLNYYSRDRIMLWEARIGWLEPDLQAMELVETQGEPCERF